MTQQIAGIFDNADMADKAVADLLQEGFVKDEFSLIMSDQTHRRLFSSTDDEADRVAKGTVTGAAIGGMLGALLAGLTAAGVLGTGGSALLVSGPVAAMLSGVGTGVVAGGFAGAFIRAGFAADEANRYAGELEDGKAVIIIHTNDARKERFARTFFKISGVMVEAA